jgi:DNA polymerase-3 subunit gamma/tau
VFEIDGASNRGVDEIRNLREAVRYPPAKGKYKVYIIDEVHMLTKEAFNALLKTLEEPPLYIVFIFATTENHKVPLTILSRCQRFDFRRIAIEEIIARLRYIASEEKIKVDDDALLLIAKRGDGSLRDAQSIFDQVVSFCGNSINAKQIADMFTIVDEELFFTVSDAIIAKDSQQGITIVEEIVQRGYDLREFLGGLVEHFRNTLIVLSTGSTKLIETSEVYKKRYTEIAKSFSETDLLRLMKLASDTESALRWTQQPRYKLEMTILQMVKMDSSVQINQLLLQIDELKKKLNGGSLTQSRISLDTVEETVPLVRGNVKATQPTLRPDQIVTTAPSVSDQIPFYQSPSVISSPVMYKTTVEPPAFRTEDQAVNFSLDEAKSKWNQFVDQARQQRIAVGTWLSESHLVNVEGNNIRIGCPDDFHADALMRHRQFLSDLANQIYGAKVKLETMLAVKPPVQPAVTVTMDIAKPEQQPSVTEPMHQPSELREHPVVKALIRDFGATEVV